MPAERISMHKFRDVLRLRDAGLSLRQIAASLDVSIGVVSKYLTLADARALTPQGAVSLDDDALTRLLDGHPNTSGVRLRAEPDFAYLHEQLKRKGVTLRLLWQEYLEQHPDDAYQYTQFCVRYQQFRQHLKLSMRQTHRAGDKLFVDYAGKTVRVFDVASATERDAQIFVAVLGASNYTFAEATWTQRSPDWIGSHARAFAFFQGVPALVVSDQLKSAVTGPHRYDPSVNRTYEEMARHYGTALLPARARKPKDKAKVEIGVQIVERWILARLRDRQFFSLRELNEAIALLLADLNARPFKKLPGSRVSAFERIEKPALRPLPQAAFEYADWVRARVGVDYHVEAHGCYYSVPYGFVRRVVDIRITATSVEILHANQRVALHARLSCVGGYCTNPDHRPEAHRAQASWSVAGMLEWAAGVGLSTHAVISRLLETRPHPEQCYRAYLGLRKLERRFEARRLEASCRRALAIGGVNVRSIESILTLGLDRIPLPDEVEPTALDLVHANVRGASYYESIPTTKEDRQC